MAECFDQRLVGIQQLHVLADHGDGDFVLGVELGVNHTLPLGQIGRTALQTKALNDEVVQALGVQYGGDAIDGINVFQTDNRTLFHVGEQRDLAARGQVDRVIRAADQYVGLQADGAQLLHRVLGRLGLGLASGGDVRHQRQVHQHGALGTHFYSQLTDSLKERLGLDVTHGTADLDQRHVGIACTFDDAALDLVGNMRNHLDGRTQVVTTALLAQHVGIDTTGGEVVVLAHGGVDETLVMAQIKVSLGAIVGYEDFAVLEGAHGARIHVDIGIQL